MGGRVGWVLAGAMLALPGGARADGLRLTVTDERATRRMIVHYAGDTPNGLRDGRLIEVTGMFGGRAFEHAPWKGLLLALAIAFGVAGAIELTRWLLKRRLPPGAATSPD